MSTTAVAENGTRRKSGKNFMEKKVQLKEARDDLKKRIHHRQASLTPSETSFLSTLLGDAQSLSNKSSPSSPAKITDDNDTLDKINNARDVLANDMLFKIPMIDDKPIWTKNGDLSNTMKDIKHHTVDGKRREVLMRRHSRDLRLSLWKSHEDGVMPSVLTRKMSQRRISTAISEGSWQEMSEDEGDSIAVDSTEEVRKEREDDDSVSTSSSWNESQGGYDHYNAWEVLKDEYAADFGFTYQNDTNVNFIANDELDVRHFNVIGTSVNDKSARPHVLSPPLMESLLNFVPESLVDNNFWLKYSLIRDGASLSTLKRYVRAAEHTIIAIESTQGNVFGSFTSSHWKTQPNYYGSGEAFLWKMRRSRNTPCHSLVDQAVLESEIDVYPFSGLNTYIQLCISDKIAIGGGKLDTSGAERHGDEIAPDTYSLHHEDLDYGFGLSFGEYLDRGTSNPCATFRNPGLSATYDPNDLHGLRKSHSDAFEIANLEVWAFTPCHNVKEAQKLELSKFYIHESTKSLSLSSIDSHEKNSPDLILSPDTFYKRVGEDDDVDQRWEDFIAHVDDDIMKNSRTGFGVYRS